MTELVLSTAIEQYIGDSCPDLVAGVLDQEAELATLREQVRAMREACECGVTQLDITAAAIEDMADRIGSQSWRDIANGCRKQSDVISRALKAAKGQS